jgi:hyaluronoglucosaminidase
LFTPTDYYGLVDGPYWEGLKRYLAPGIDVAWTGQYVLTSSVTGAQAGLLARDTGHPIIFWDNYPVNDYTYTQPPHRPHLFMGPVTGRSANLPAHLAGYLVNPMLQARASELALYTTAQYLKDPTHYRPWSAWIQGVRLLGGPAYAAFLLFCQDSRGSYLSGSLSGNPALNNELAAFAKDPAHPTAALVDELHASFTAMAGVNAVLRAKLPDRVLYRELAPWAAQLSLEGQMGLAAVAVVQDNAASKPVTTPLTTVLGLEGQVAQSSFTLDTTGEVLKFAREATAGS